MSFEWKRKSLVGGVIGHSVLLVILVVVATQFDVAKNQVLSGWIQAIGSVLAIVFAVYVSDQQNVRQEMLRKKEREEQYVKLVGYASYVCQGMLEAWSYLSSLSPKKQNYDRHLRLLDDSLDLIRSVDVNSIFDAEIALSWIMLRHNICDFVGHMKECSTDSVVGRLDNLKRCIGRANDSVEKIKKIGGGFS